MRTLLVMLFVMTVLISGCGGGGSSEEQDRLVVRQLNYEVKAPANVTVAFKVETNAGIPVAGLDTGDFTTAGAENVNFEIWENKNKISQDESFAKIDPDSGDFDYYVYLLLDLSQSILNNSLEETRLGALTLVEDLYSKGFRTDNLKVKVAFFDGSDAVQVIQGFTSDKDTLIAEINKIDEDTSNDPSTNLYGAVVQAVDELNTTIQTSQDNEEKYIVAGSLVVFTDGTDQANRTSKSEAIAAVNNANNNAKIFTIGLGGETNEAVLDEIGKSGYKKAENAESLVETFSEIANLITQETESFYILRYCSPKRGGATNTLTLKVQKDGLVGETSLVFNADDFVSGCVIE